MPSEDDMIWPAVNPPTMLLLKGQDLTDMKNGNYPGGPKCCPGESGGGTPGGPINFRDIEGEVAVSQLPVATQFMPGIVQPMAADGLSLEGALLRVKLKQDGSLVTNGQGELVVDPTVLDINQLGGDKITYQKLPLATSTFPGIVKPGTGLKMTGTDSTMETA